MRTPTLCRVLALTALLCPLAGLAHEPVTTGPTPDSHAPMGVMGDHTHEAGEWMFSYRLMTMSMEGNRRGRDRLDADTIATTEANPFADAPMMPPTLRVVPRQMDTQMHMLGLMYSPTEGITLMAMANYLDREMSLVAFEGGMGTERLGQFTTRSAGWGDTRVSALIDLYDDGTHRWHLNAGVSAPTGSIEETDTVLTPMNTRPDMRLPYAMQLGSGTWDLQPGVTYNGHSGRWSWGSQYRARLRLDENDEGYALGDRHQLTGWGAYRWRPWISTSVRLSARSEDEIDGRDENIMAPVQTADPANYGGEFVDLSLGANLVGRNGAIAGHRLGLEWTRPVYQDPNGLQMDRESMVVVAYQYSW